MELRDLERATKLSAKLQQLFTRLSIVDAWYSNETGFDPKVYFGNHEIFDAKTANSADWSVMIADLVRNALHDERDNVVEDMRRIGIATNIFTGLTKMERESLAEQVNAQTYKKGEGWGLFNHAVPRHMPYWHIERIDEDDVFKDDASAAEFVIEKALAGSHFHQQALRIIHAGSTDHWKQIEREARRQSIIKDDLFKEAGL